LVLSFSQVFSYGQSKISKASSSVLAVVTKEAGYLLRIMCYIRQSMVRTFPESIVCPGKF